MGVTGGGGPGAAGCGSGGVLFANTATDKRKTNIFNSIRISNYKQDFVKL